MNGMGVIRGRGTGLPHVSVWPGYPLSSTAVYNFTRKNYIKKNPFYLLLSSASLTLASWSKRLLWASSSFTCCCSNSVKRAKWEIGHAYTVVDPDLEVREIPALKKICFCPFADFGVFLDFKKNKRRAGRGGEGSPGSDTDFCFRPIFLLVMLYVLP